MGTIGLHSFHHHTSLALLSLGIAVFGSWAALDLFRRVRSHVGLTRKLWLAAAAVAMGLSIWAMHFVAMLGFDPGSPASYDLPLTFLSLALAIAATCGAFFAAAAPGASNVRLIAAGLAMGAGICLMHYVGMAALRTAVSLGYRPGYVVAAFAIAVIAATAALFAARQEHSVGWRVVAALVLGVAIAGMHYTAMAGVTLAPGHLIFISQPGAPPYVLAMAVAAGTLIILLLALLASFYDQRLNVLSALEAGGVGYFELSLPDMTLHMSPTGRAIFGRDPAEPFLHADLLDAIHPEDRAKRDELFARALSDGGVYDAQYRLADEGEGPRWINVRSRVMARRRGAPSRLGGVVMDVTEQQRAFVALAQAERRQRTLIDELNHRVKNTLATVQSIARQTGKQAGSLEDFRRDFEARLISLSQAHNALTRGGWETASLRELVEQELLPYSLNQTRLEGPEVALPSRQTLGIGMVLHELATNAAKYGALSTPNGCVRVSWAVEQGELILRWAESDGPPVKAPTRTGFGSRLIKGTIEAELRGKAQFSYDPTGFTGEMRIPLRAATAYGEEGAI